MRALMACVALLLGCSVAEGAPRDCEGETLTIGERQATRLADGSVLFRAPMAVDADGSPHAYHPEDIGLDALANAGKPGKWWGVVVDAEGRPIVQGPDDPAPGYHVSPTSLFDPQYAETDPRRYVDAEQIHYVALPPELVKWAEIKAGDLALVSDRESGTQSFAIFADVGPRAHLGEGSLALARLFEPTADARRKGVARELVYLVWPRSGDRRPHPNAWIDEQAKLRLERWGGAERLARCMAD